MAELKRIQFLQSWGIYNAGESAGLSAQQAAHLQKLGVVAYAEDVAKEEAANAEENAKQRAGNKSRAEAAAEAAAKPQKKKAAGPKAKAKADAAD